MLRNPSHKNGQAMVEFALTIGIIMLILMGIFDLGRIIYTTTSLSNAAREGARVAAVNGDSNAIKSAVIATGIGLNIQPGQIGITYCLVPDCSSTQTDRSKEMVAVKISITNYPFTAITPFIGRMFGPSETMNLSTSASMTIEKP